MNVLYVTSEPPVEEIDRPVCVVCSKELFTIVAGEIKMHHYYNCPARGPGPGTGLTCVTCWDKKKSN